MINVAECLYQTHDRDLLIMALVVCCLGSAVVFNLVPRVLSRSDPMGSWFWLPLASLVTGSVIWATHFIAMLAFRPPMPTAYTIEATLSSYLLAVVYAGIAFGVLRALRGCKGAVLAGAILGFATVVMHYVGVSGLRVEGDLSWNKGYVALSIIMSIAIAVAALLAARDARSWRRRYAGAGLFALSILSLHFLGMSAITLTPNPALVLPDGLLSGELVGYGIGAVALLIIGGGFASWGVDQRLKREREQRLQFLARHDPLTGLPNRAHFEEVVNRQLARVERHNCAVLYIDLDGFKDVNDLFGHPAGDRLLVEVGGRLQALLGERCIAARLGGDEFAVLATGLGRDKSAENAAQSVVEAIAAPFYIDGNRADIGCSVGVAVCPSDGTHYATLLSRADIALGRAKADGKNTFRFFEPAMDAAVHERRRMAADLRGAVHRGELRLEYQPQFNLRTGAATGFEALVRWDHPEKGRVLPADFIAVAEETGLIFTIGEWVMREACREAASWELPLCVSINISAAQFRHNSLSELVAAALRDSGLPPSRLEIEVTESVLIDSEPRALMALHAIKAQGVRIAMDDFGTGYSSLSTLQRFPFDTIKIDQTFTAQLGIGAKTTAIVKAILNLGAELDMRLVAEGVETPEQAEMLRDGGCNEAQGFLFGRPRPIEEHRALLQSARAGKASMLRVV